MANVKITGLPAASSAALTQLVEIVNDPSGTPTSQKLSFTLLDALFFAVTAVRRFLRVGIGAAADATVPLLVNAPNNAVAMTLKSASTTGFGASMTIDSTSFTGGHNWQFISGSAADGVGLGGFSIYDATAGVDRLKIDTSGAVRVVSAGLQVEGTAGIGFASRSQVFSPVNGAIQLRNAANNANATLTCSDIASTGAISATGNVLSNTNLLVQHTVNSGFGASVQLDSTSHTGGRNWIVYSGSAADPAGAGSLGIFDVTAAVDRVRIDTSGNLTLVNSAARFIGNGTLPAGAILMWSGTIASIPAGFVLCNGSNGTPDLRNMFVVGANADSGGVAKSTITGSALQTGGTTSHSHTVTDPTHNHAFLTYPTPHGAANGTDFDTIDITGSGATVPVDSSATGVTVDSVSTVQPFFALAYIMKT